MKELKHKKYLVVGLGKSGISAARILIQLGKIVAVADDRKFDELSDEGKALIEEYNLTSYLNTNGKKIEKFETLVISPGVPLENPIVMSQQEKGAEIIGELELAYMIGEGTFIGITGTNGKTTTTSLVGEIFNTAQKDTRIVGNIGMPVIEEAYKSKKDTFYVTEISSFQLETIKTFKPKVAALLNITPDHLDRHGTIEKYAAAKLRIGENQSEDDYIIFNLDDCETDKIKFNHKGTIVEFSKEQQVNLGAFVKDDKIYIKDRKGKEILIINVEDIPLPGTHNLENVLAAVAMCYFSGIAPEYIKNGILKFQGVEHRVEIFEEHNGIMFVNDSKGTNPDAAIKAIEAMKGNIILIAGGYDKGADFEDLLLFGKDKIKALCLLGQTKEKIARQAKNIGISQIYQLENMKECVEQALSIANPGDKVLLSPACASWGMYKNYEERGREFKEIVKKNKEKIT